MNQASDAISPERQQPLQRRAPAIVFDVPRVTLGWHPAERSYCRLTPAQHVETGVDMTTPQLSAAREVPQLFGQEFPFEHVVPQNTTKLWREIVLGGRGVGLAQLGHFEIGVKAIEGEDIVSFGQANVIGKQEMVVKITV